METLLKKMFFNISFKHKVLFMNIVPYIFIVLFIYTATSKIFTYNSFSEVLAIMLKMAPIFKLLNNLVPKLNYILAISIISFEIIVSGVLIPKPKLGLWLSLGLMMVFTFYLVYMVSLKIQLPCSCGGVISLMTWPQHIWFNISFILLAVGSLILYTKSGKVNSQ